MTILSQQVDKKWKTKTRFFGRIKQMIILLTHRRVLKALYKIITKEGNGIYKLKGITLTEVTDILYSKEFFPKKSKFKNFLLSIYLKINKSASPNFYYVIEEVIKDCIKEDYLEIEKLDKLRITWKGKRFISKIGWIADFTKNPFVLEIVKYGLVMGIPAYLFYKVIELWR